MERYAQISDGVVNIVIESATDPDGINGEWVACGDAVSPGWTTDDRETFYPPAPAPVAVRHLSKLGFRNRFTPTEKATIEFASLDNPAAPMPARMLAAGIRASMADQRDAAFIDQTRPDTRQGVIDMEAGGLLASGRALQILDAPIEDLDMFMG